MNTDPSTIKTDPVSISRAYTLTNSSVGMPLGSYAYSAYGVSECLKLSQHKTWSERLSIEQLLSQLTRYLGTKKRHHRTQLRLPVLLVLSRNCSQYH